jgi:hypothetical protein
MPNESKQTQNTLLDERAIMVRQISMTLIGLFLTYLFLWLPWQTNRSHFLLFFGAGLIQLSVIYMEDVRDDPMGFRFAEPKPLFLSASLLCVNNLVYLIVLALAIAGLVMELVVGFHGKPWWEAILLPVPPYLFGLLILFPRHNPAPPFIAGIAAFIIALGLKLTGTM